MKVLQLTGVCVLIPVEEVEGQNNNLGKSIVRELRPCNCLASVWF